MTLGIAGLAIVALAWAFQMGRSWRGKGMSNSFILLYGIGAALLTTAGAQGGFSVEGWLNLLILLLVALTFIKTHR